MNVAVGIRFNFDCSQNEFRLIVKALRSEGGSGPKLADELEQARAKHFAEIARRFSTFSNSSEGEDISRKKD
jgi:hypothetical protein